MENYKKKTKKKKLNLVLLLILLRVLGTSGASVLSCGGCMMAQKALWGCFLSSCSGQPAPLLPSPVELRAQSLKSLNITTGQNLGNDES